LVASDADDAPTAETIDRRQVFGHFRITSAGGRILALCLNELDAIYIVDALTLMAEHTARQIATGEARFE
jgi:hypothetical protein